MEPLQTIADVEMAMTKLRLDPLFEWDPTIDDPVSAYYQSKGRVRLLIEVMKGENVDFQMSSDRGDEFSQILRVVWLELKRKFNNRDLSYLCAGKADFVLRQRFNEVSTEFSQFQTAGITAARLYDAADAGIIRYIDEKVQLLHLTDLWYCMKMFEKSPNEPTLNIKEQVSLLFSHNASMDEVNESLVQEALIANGLIVGQLGKLLFRKASQEQHNCFHGIVRHTGHNLKGEHIGENGIKEVSELGDFHPGIAGISLRNRAASLRKEYPDELGADLIATFKVSSRKKALIGKKFIVVRVQIKLGLSNKSVGDPIGKMRENEGLIANAMGIELDEILFVRVIWTSRPTTTQEKPDDFCVVIKSDNMLNYWSGRVCNFVRQEKLASYGFRQ